MTSSDNTLDGNGQGIAVASGGSATVFGTIIANSGTASCSAPVTTDNGYNLDHKSGETDPCGFSTAAHDVVETNPQLGPLQNNGGGTDTEAILAGSPAHDVIPAASCPATDQRGVSRPQPASATFLSWQCT